MMFRQSRLLLNRLEKIPLPMLNSFFKKSSDAAAQEKPAATPRFQSFKQENVQLNSVEMNEFKGGQLKSFTKIFSWNTSCGDLVKQ